MGIRNRERRKEKMRKRRKKSARSTPPRNVMHWKYADGEWVPLTRKARLGLVKPPDA